MPEDAPRRLAGRMDEWVLPAGAGDERVSHRAYARMDHDGNVWVAVDGQTIVVPPPDSGRRSARAGNDPLGMAAPMPATVIRLFVTEGDLLQAGDAVLVLEAMKMELPIRAPRAGRVTAIHCAVGDLVQPGRTLVDVDEES